MINAIFGAGSICFSLALLPAIKQHKPPPVFTCALTAFWLWMFTICYVLLHFAFAAIAGGTTAFLWTVLLWQAIRERRIT